MNSDKGMSCQLLRSSYLGWWGYAIEQGWEYWVDGRR